VELKAPKEIQAHLEMVVHKVQQGQKAHKVQMVQQVLQVHQELVVHKAQQVLKAQLGVQAHQVL
jgi:hypothetical protein